MLVVDDPSELTEHIGQDIGPSDWMTVDQSMINRFAEATGDRQWIHVDVERARRDLPGGTTIAHGYLTLALVPLMRDQTLEFRGVERLINYGLNRVRFTNPVAAGARVRMRQKITSVEDTGDGGMRITAEYTVEIEGEDRPALIAETITLAYA